MIRIILAISLLFITTQSFAEEMWACSGFTFNDGSSDNHPFLMKGSKQKYTWMGKDFSAAIKFVGESLGVWEYRIYVDETVGFKKAYYLLFDNNKLTIRSFGWDRISQANCTKQ